MPGDSLSSRRLFSLLFAGTIPVIICDECMLPFQALLDYSKFTISLPQQVILDGHLDMFEVLLEITQEEIEALQYYGRLAKKHFMFNEGKPQPGDALDLLVGFRSR